jgi:hypothetical protein
MADDVSDDASDDDGDEMAVDGGNGDPDANKRAFVRLLFRLFVKDGVGAGQKVGVKPLLDMVKKADYNVKEMAAKFISSQMKGRFDFQDDDWLKNVNASNLGTALTKVSGTDILVDRERIIASYVSATGVSKYHRGLSFETAAKETDDGPLDVSGQHLHEPTSAPSPGTASSMYTFPLGGQAFNLQTLANIIKWIQDMPHDTFRQTFVQRARSALEDQQKLRDNAKEALEARIRLENLDSDTESKLIANTQSMFQDDETEREARLQRLLASTVSSTLPASASPAFMPQSQDAGVLAALSSVASSGAVPNCVKLLHSTQSDVAIENTSFDADTDVNTVVGYLKGLHTIAVQSKKAIDATVFGDCHVVFESNGKKLSATTQHKDWLEYNYDLSTNVATDFASQHKVRPGKRSEMPRLVACADQLHRMWKDLVDGDGYDGTLASAFFQEVKHAQGFLQACIHAIALVRGRSPYILSLVVQSLQTVVYSQYISLTHLAL